jgi:antitoxin HicB
MGNPKRLPARFYMNAAGKEPVRNWLQRGVVARVHQEDPEDARARQGARQETQNRGGARMKNRHVGSSFDSFLEEEGVKEEVHGVAQKRVIAWQLEEAMRALGLTKVEMAERMQTSRTQVDRVLDPDNDKVRLDTIQRAARAVGRELRIALV